MKTAEVLGSLYECTERAIALTLVVAFRAAVVLAKCFYVKVFNVSGKALTGKLSCTQTGLDGLHGHICWQKLTVDSRNVTLRNMTINQVVARPGDNIPYYDNFILPASCRKRYTYAFPAP